MTIHTFIYYGSKISKADYENLTHKMGITDLYARVYGAGLQFREIGEIGKSWEYVIGKEITWVTDEPVTLDDKLNIDNENLNMMIDDTNEVRQKLLQIGITQIPRYYVFSCWE